MTQLRNDTLLTLDLIFLVIKVCLFVYFTNGKAATPPVSKIVPEIPHEILKELEEASDVVDVVAKYWRLLFLSRWAFSVISYLVRFEHEEETGTVLIMDLAQAILIFIDVGLCYVYATKVIGEIPPEILEELEEVTDVRKSLVTGVAECWREILGGAVAVLFTLTLGQSMQTSTRHLLDLSEDERWRYIEAKETKDLEEHDMDVDVDVKRMPPSVPSLDVQDD